MTIKIFSIPFVLLLVLCHLSMNCKRLIEHSYPEISTDIELVDRVVAMQILYSINQDNRLNDSHSDSWVQCTSDGTIGIVYREIQNGPGNNSTSLTGSNTMNLLFKTITASGIISNETVTSGNGVERSVFIFDSDNNPHIFFARSGDSQHEIFHFYKNNNSGWANETIMQFTNTTGQYIFELSAAVGPGNTLHLLALKTGTHPVDDFLYAHRNNYLLYISNKNGRWEQELIQNFDTVYLQINVRNDGLPYYYMRVFKRQDLVIDSEGHAHAAYGALRPIGSEPYPTEMRYANNISGDWLIEVSLEPSDESCDAGSNPSIAIDGEGRVMLVSTFIERVPSKSAQYAQLLFSYREKNSNWKQIVIADTADDYMGADGGDFTGAMPHLVLDTNNYPHIVFSDITSTHMWGGSVLNIGQIRYARYTGSKWELSTLYRQDSPDDYNTINEMHGQCLAISRHGSVQIIGQEFLSGEHNQTYNLLHFILQ